MASASAPVFEERPDSISRPPSAFEYFADRAVRVGTLVFAWSIVGLVTVIVLRIAFTARPAVAQFGTELLRSSTWDTNRDLFGLLRARYTIAIVTHNLQQAKRVADQTAFMYVDTSEGGRTGYLVEFRETAEMFEDPRERHTQEYLRGEFS